SWHIVISQGIEKVDSWISRAEGKVREIEGRVGGSRNAWEIVIRQGIEKVDTWLDLAKNKVAAIQELVGSESYAWQAVIMWGVERVLDEVERRQRQVDDIVRREGLSRGEAWLRVIGAENEAGEDVAADRSSEAGLVSSGDERVGGIDFNPSYANIKTEGNAQGRSWNVDPAALRNINIEGFSPVIIQMTPITNWNLLLSPTNN
ncbi:MAG: hypothetical protein NUV91_01040, partial [Candidatus Omnitrophica bacterium]|nr:hypothetical protein [Candidatus Omnitrophota bacterium]